MTVDDPIAKDTVPGTPTYGLILQGPESTVCSEAPAAPAAEGAYQSEADLEAGLIDILTHQGYDRLYVETEAELVANLRRKLEELNGIEFTDASGGGSARRTSRTRRSRSSTRRGASRTIRSSPSSATTARTRTSTCWIATTSTGTASR